MSAPTLTGPLGNWQPLPLPARRRDAVAEAGGAPTSGSVSGFAMETQEAGQWCWAAVATSIARKYDRRTSWTQCRVASTFYSGQGQDLQCCGNDKPACNLPQALSQVFAVTGNLAGEALPSTIDYDELCREIRADRPVCVRIGWPPDLENGHFVTITGFRAGSDGVRYLDVQDPADDGDPDNRKQFSLDEFTSNYDQVGGEWTWTYRTQGSTS